MKATCWYSLPVVCSLSVLTAFSAYTWSFHKSKWLDSRLGGDLQTWAVFASGNLLPAVQCLFWNFVSLHISYDFTTFCRIEESETLCSLKKQKIKRKGRSERKSQGDTWHVPLFSFLAFTLFPNALCILKILYIFFQRYTLAFFFSGDAIPDIMFETFEMCLLPSSLCVKY